MGNKTLDLELLRKRNFPEAMRVYVDRDIKNNKQLEPYYGLITDGEATVTITQDEFLNIHVKKAESHEEELTVELEAKETKIKDQTAQIKELRKARKKTVKKTAAPIE